jgi:hypothetical protein
MQDASQFAIRQQRSCRLGGSIAKRQKPLFSENGKRNRRLLNNKKPSPSLRCGGITLA